LKASRWMVSQTNLLHAWWLNPFVAGEFKKT